MAPGNFRMAASNGASTRSWIEVGSVAAGPISSEIEDAQLAACAKADSRGEMASATSLSDAGSA